MPTTTATPTTTTGGITIGGILGCIIDGNTGRACHRKRMIVKGERLKRAILAVLADKELQKILDAAMYQCKSANQIIRESNITHRGR